MSLEILQYPAEKLRQVSDEIAADDLVSEYLRKLSDKMIATIGGQHYGLAAIQIDVPLRLFVARGRTRNDEPFALFNPKITWRSSMSEWAPEACLSVGNGKIERAVKRNCGVRVEYIDVNGKPKSLKCAGFLARVIQHEMDHLDGRLIVDHAGPGQ